MEDEEGWMTWLNQPKKKPKYKPKWNDLPDLAIEGIFQHLDKRSRYNAACTCKAWLRVLRFPALWKTYVFKDRTLTRSRAFTVIRGSDERFSSGYQDVLDPFITQICLKRIGWHFRKLKICPISNFKNLYEFMNIVDSFLTYFDYCPMPHLRSFEFIFACQIRNSEGTQIFGTGGRILKALTTLMGHCNNLEELSLQNLLLEKFEATTLLDSVLDSRSEGLKHLTLMNCTKLNHVFLHAGAFLNLRTLTITVNHLHKDLVYLIGELKSFEELHLVQTEFTNTAAHLAPKDWLPLRTSNKRVQLFIESRGKTKDEIIWHSGAPVNHIVHGTPYAKLTCQAALECIHQYDSTLISYSQLGIPRFSYHRGRPYHERCDAHLLLMVRICTRLTTLMIHELISTSSLLLIAFHTKGQLKNLYVRRNAILLKMDWANCKEAGWSSEFYAWLKRSSKDYDLFHQGMSELLGRPWKSLSDLEFKKLSACKIEY